MKPGPGSAALTPCLRKILLIGEVALTLALLNGAGLLVSGRREIIRLSRLPLLTKLFDL